MKKRQRTARIRYQSAELRKIHDLWGVATIRGIARHLNRPLKGIRSMATKLGLRCRIDGYESIRSAATRAGVTYHVMCNALKYAGVQLYKKPGTGIERTTRRVRANGTRRKPGRHRMVAILDADAAIETYRATESLHSAEARSGMHEKGLVRALAKIGVVRPPLARKCIWRIAKADVDRAVAVYVQGETLCDAAQRIGISRDTMRVWLRTVGLLRTRLATYTTEELQLAIDAARARPYARARALQVAA